MFGRNTARVIETSSEIAAPAPEHPAAPSEAERYRALLQRWMSFAEVQNRAFQALSAEVGTVSKDVEGSALSLSDKFQVLATGARDQTARAERMSDIAAVVELGSERVPLEALAKEIGATLDDIIQKCLGFSEHAIRVVYALDDVVKEIKEVESCIQRIDRINRETNMLAMNATIEAVRAGEAGKTFKVVANEVRDLSRSTDSLAQTMRKQIGAVVSGIHQGHEILQKAATIDLSPNVMAKDRLDQLMLSLLHRNEDLSQAMAATRSSSTEITGTIGDLTMTLQFQDRSKQRLEHVVTALSAVTDALTELRSSTAEVLPEGDANLAPDREWMAGLLDRFSLSDVRSRMEASLESGAVDTSAPAATSNGDVELF